MFGSKFWEEIFGEQIFFSEKIFFLVGGGGAKWGTISFKSKFS